MYDHYVPVLVAALVVLLLGVLNLKMLRSKCSCVNGECDCCGARPALLAAAALLSGCAAVLLMDHNGLMH